MDHEIKTFSFELKEVDEEEGTFTGYAATFSDKPDSWGDIIDKGAFKKTLKERVKQIKILWNHDTYEPIGRPMELSEDDYGLLFKGKLTLEVQRAKEVLALMKDGVINEMSIGYNAIKEKVIDNVRHLQEIKLYDISPVSFAANPDAVITGVKAEQEPNPDEHTCLLRNPDDFQDGSFKRMTRVSNGKKYSVIMGKLEGEDNLTEQAYRYGKELWEEADAMTHSKDHDGKFEPAEKQSKTGRVLSSANLEKVKKGVKDIQAGLESIQALLEAAESEPEPDKSTLLSEADKEAAELEQTIAILRAHNEGIDTKEAEKSIEAMLEKMRK